MTDHNDIQQFQDARFGLMIHWGLYAIPGGEWKGQRMPYIGEWIQSAFRIPGKEYARLAERFNPQGFNADEWVRLAKDAGMRYIVYTAKHHDGFAMYHSKVDPYNIYDATPFQRDPLAELAEACHKHGLELGLYYSQDLDWHEPDGGDPGPDYPLNARIWSWGNNWDFPEHASKHFERFFEKKVKPQVRELLSNYGPVRLIWFDCPLTISPEQSRELVDLVKSLQPGCLVNSRVGNEMGDYSSMGDNEVPSGQVGGARETPATMNDTWGYKSFDDNWKSPRDLLSILVGLASKNVNYLLNVGPQPDGRFPEGAVRTLQGLAKWARPYGEAIHATRQGTFPYDFEWGWVTMGPQRLYLFLKDPAQKRLLLRGLRTPVRRAFDLADAGREIAFRQVGEALELDLLGFPPESFIPVVTLELESAVDVDDRLMAQAGEDGRPVLVLPAARARMWAEGIPVEEGPTLLPTGILGGWHNPRAWVEWDVELPGAGEYEVEVISSALHHSAEWKGGHTVRVEVGGAGLEARMALDEPVQSPEAIYYPQALSRLGAMQIEQGGSTTVVLRALAIEENGGKGLALVSLKLRGRGWRVENREK
jgi:alpha-L-fucosidase